MFRSTQSFAQHTPGTINLEISDPVLMLNEIAKRYESTERVLMEYVDNALDDAEALYREHDGAYPYPIRIDILADFQAGSITIQDNCRGMTREVLERVVRNVGESQKRGQSWLNGRFGFGVHAFRAAADRITFQTKHALSSHHTLTLHREQHRGIKEAKRVDAPFPTGGGSGCVVTLADFQPDWLQAVTAASIQAEIERHFERIIARPNLQITVQAAGAPPLRCTPFAYDPVAGTAVVETLPLTYKDETFPVTVHLKVAAAPQRRPVSFFARGRRIGAATDIKSFMRKSAHKTSVWGHPNLIGYIEVGDIVEPIINRDDFVRTRSRTLLYEAVLPLESRLKRLLAQINQAQQQSRLTQLEDVVQTVWQTVRPDAPHADPVEIAFVEEPGMETAVTRTRQQENVIYINMAHPDFQARIRYTRQGQPRITDRLNAYLAAVLAVHSIQPDGVDKQALLAQQLDVMMQMETILQQQGGKMPLGSAAQP